MIPSLIAEHLLPVMFSPAPVVGALLLLFLLCREIRTYLSLRQFGGHWSAGFSRLWLLRAGSSGRMHEYYTELNSKYGTWTHGLCSPWHRRRCSPFPLPFNVPITCLFRCCVRDALVNQGVYSCTTRYLVEWHALTLCNRQDRSHWPSHAHYLRRCTHPKNERSEKPVHQVQVVPGTAASPNPR